MGTFHADERAAQALAGRVLADNPAIRPFMPDQHRTFFAGLSWLFLGAVDETGSPIATVLTGEPGFVRSPDATHLTIAAAPGPDDPAAAALAVGAQVGLLGIDLATRRRNRANGTVVDREGGGLTVAIEESFGNCPKYIQRREHWPLARKPGATQRLAGLDEAARGLIEGRTRCSSQAARGRGSAVPTSRTGAGGRVHPGGGGDADPARLFRQPLLQHLRQSPRGVAGEPAGPGFRDRRPARAARRDRDRLERPLSRWVRRRGADLAPACPPGLAPPGGPPLPLEPAGTRRADRPHGILGNGAAGMSCGRVNPPGPERPPPRWEVLDIVHRRAMAQSNHGAMGGCRMAKILLVEDHEEIWDFLSRRLKRGAMK